ncbi:hypothetical protein K439DRAFT_1628786 [Ramaria rubella]|nr:hypothetical protein K439DRAFT_1628786 [Ramaria rubella]
MNLQRSLTDLPVELIAELYMLALSPVFPHTCKYIHSAIQSSPSSVHAKYIFGRHPPGVYCTSSKDAPIYISGSPFTRALRYPICTIPVLESMLRIISRTPRKEINIDISNTFELPRRLFRSLGKSEATLNADSEPLPLLRFLWEERPSFSFVTPIVNSHDGYPLVRAVHARFTPLIRFLLDHGADPEKRDYMAVKVAIGKKDLELVKMLIEFEPEAKANATKKRRRADRVEVKPFMLDMAVRYDARDIVQYLMEEKGCIPHMKTLRAI